MLVKDIMKSNVVTISALATVREAMQKMRQHGIKSLVVEKGNEHDAYGLITYTDILKTIVAEEGDIDLLNVYDICAKPALIVSRELDVKYVAKLMVNMSLPRILVTSANELVGIITMNDIVGAILEMADGDC
ncbi:CBS domain-containing protein [Halopseudomonas phragmitis]|uniref:Histidine kinase n=1 Tax=Halopseudomonas phragmitis TaxID=1931241 RepID=A0A1V0B3T7_9GAMM|nr:CBS domain-containing protein [Halopseudomonas phragmitis]AQZ94599.1 histidine kinase [Halopseudomonas phragmitis]PAU88332.1 histidine kinase [Pseudomonas sp. WN033]